MKKKTKRKKRQRSAQNAPVSTTLKADLTKTPEVVVAATKQEYRQENAKQSTSEKQREAAAKNKQLQPLSAEDWTEAVAILDGSARLGSPASTDSVAHDPILPALDAGSSIQKREHVHPVLEFSNINSSAK